MAGSGSENRQRHETLKFRATAEEAALVREQAKRRGLSVASILHYAVLNIPPLRASRQPAISEEIAASILGKLGQVATALRACEGASDPGKSDPRLEAAQRDIADAFRLALEHKGYILAKGDQRGFVVVDKLGNPHSLTRHIKDHKASAVKKKLSPLTPDQLPSVDQAKEQMRQRALAQAEHEQEREKRKQETAPDREGERPETQRKQKEEAFAAKQAARRLALAQAEQEMLTRHQAERLALHAAQKSESRGFLFRVRSAVADLIGRTPGLRSVLGPIQQVSGLDPRERHRLESNALARRHAREKRAMEGSKRKLSLVETRERQSREKALRREQRLRQETRIEVERTAEQASSMDNVAMQDFYDAARDQELWKERAFKDHELRASFNDAAGFVEGTDETGDDGEDYAPDWKDEADSGGDDDGPRHRRKRGKGYGFRRDSD